MRQGRELASSDLLGPRASRPQVSAKRENELELLLKDCAPPARLRAGRPVPAIHLTLMSTAFIYRLVISKRCGA